LNHFYILYIGLFAYFFHESCYKRVDRYNQACSDYKKAKKLGLKEADDFLDELGCY